MKKSLCFALALALACGCAAAGSADPPGTSAVAPAHAIAKQHQAAAAVAVAPAQIVLEARQPAGLVAPDGGGFVLTVFPAKDVSAVPGLARRLRSPLWT